MRNFRNCTTALKATGIKKFAATAKVSENDAKNG